MHQAGLVINEVYTTYCRYDSIEGGEIIVMVWEQGKTLETMTATVFIYFYNGRWKMRADEMNGALSAYQQLWSTGQAYNTDSHCYQQQELGV